MVHQNSFTFYTDYFNMNMYLPHGWKRPETICIGKIHMIMGEEDIMDKAYKLIAVDMDGTLLKSDKTIHEDTVHDICDAVGNGMQIVYCTGRALSEMQFYFAVLPMVRYAVCYSGAIVYDCMENRCIYRAEIAQRHIMKIVETAKRYNAMAHFMTEEESIVASADIKHMNDFHMGIYQDMFRKVTRQVSDMEEEGKLHDTIAKSNIYFQSVGDRDKGYEELKKLPLTFAFAEETGLEMNAKCVTKGTGLERLAEYLHIPISQTAGIGDAENDRHMLHTVGFSVAMGNADGDIKGQCDFVTEDNDHNGVGKAIRHIMSIGDDFATPP